MQLSQLIKKLEENKVPGHWYAIDDGLKADALILYKNYSVWEFFYLSEKGDRLGFKAFENEEAAYDYLWLQIEYELSVFNIKHTNMQDPGTEKRNNKL